MFSLRLLPKNPDESARSWVYRVVLEAIVHLDLEPTAPLDTDELRALFQLSRTPIREALIQLAQEGFVTLLPQRGSYVAPIDPAEVEKARFIRLCLEKEILARACSCCGQAAYRTLRYLLDCQADAIEANDDRLLYELDEKFHATYFEACRRGNIWAYLRRNNLHFHRFRVLNMTMRDMRRYTYRHHEELFATLRKRDEKAAVAAIENHLDIGKWGASDMLKRNPRWLVPSDMPNGDEIG
ncbi:MAG: GntR family transcriptional regulator [Planctomycetota bacterium]|jgi:DNA-binding GntR family transcriptional regulator|nr:GntR family transcriptional regulator [Planctomycetota bacterium]